MLKILSLKLVILLEYQGYTPNWSEEIFEIKKIKNTVLRIYAINDLNGEEIVGIFYEKESQKTI